MALGGGPVHDPGRAGSADEPAGQVTSVSAMSEPTDSSLRAPVRDSYATEKARAVYDELVDLARGAGFSEPRIVHTSDLGETWGNVFVVTLAPG